MSELTPEQQHTRLRIVGKPNDAQGRNVRVYDADTGEEVTNACRITLTLDPWKTNYAEVTYFPMQDGRVLKAESGEGAIEQVMTLGGSEVDVTAYVGSERYEDIQGGV